MESLPRVLSQEEVVRIQEIENLTGLRGLRSVFENSYNTNEIGVIMSHMNRQHMFAQNRDPCRYLNDLSGISVSILSSFGADNEEYYWNFSTSEAVESILTRLIGPRMEAINGFPAFLNLSVEEVERLPSYMGRKYYLYNPRTDTRHLR